MNFRSVIFNCVLLIVLTSCFEEPKQSSGTTQAPQVSEIKITSAPEISTGVDGLIHFELENIVTMTDDVLAQYTWSFGDNTLSELTNSAQNIHKYDNNGIYNATLNIEDINNNAESINIDIQVNVISVLSKIEITSEYTPSTENFGSIELDLTNHIFVTNDISPIYTWSFGDNSPTQQTPLALVQHKYAENGLYNVTLNIQDSNKNAEPLTIDMQININSVPSKIEIISEYTPPIDTQGFIEFDISNNINMTNDITPIYTWFYGDSTSDVSTSASINHEYSENDVYLVKVIISDVNQLAPSISIEFHAPITSIINSEISTTTTETIIESTGNVILNFTEIVTMTNDVAPVYSWNFDDGSAPINTNIAYIEHQYLTNGEYNAQLIIADKNNQAPSITIDITIIISLPEMITIVEDPTVTFGYDGTVDFNLTDESIIFTQNITPKFTWYFGDNNEVVETTSSNISHQFSANGTYEILLIISDNNLLADQKYLTLNIEITSVVDAITDLDFNHTNSQLEFSFLSTVIGADDQTEYVWDFGDNQQSTEINPTHTYLLEGVYNVNLTVRNARGSISILKTIYASNSVNQAPTAIISNTISNYLEVDFSALTSFDPEGVELIYSWDFGDGTILNNANIAELYSYKAPGSYLVTLTVSDGELDSKALLNITVTSNSELDSPYINLLEQAMDEFILTPCGYCHYQQFINTNLSFGINGSDITANSTETGLIYWIESGGLINRAMPIDGSNAHAVTFDSSTNNTQLWNDLLDSININLIAQTNTDPIAVISTPEITDLTVNINASTSSDFDNHDLTYIWNFDGEIITGEYATHTFLNAGLKTIELSVSDEFGGINTQFIEVNLEQPNTPPIANFTFTTNGLNAFFDASLSEDYENDSLSYYWELGDSTINDVQPNMTINHLYNTAGSYSVTLTVTDSQNNFSSITKIISVENNSNSAPIADFTYEFNGLTTSLLDDSQDIDGDNLTIQWFINGSYFSDSRLATYTFVNSGDHTITLHVSDSRGATDSIIKTITIENQPPKANFYISKLNEEVTLDASSSTDIENDPLTYSWDLGDGTIKTGESITHSYLRSGEFSIELTVSDGTNSNIFTRQIDVIVPINNQPIAQFYTNEISGTTYLFNAEMSYDPDGDSLLFVWDFGDGNNSSSSSTNHTYETEGQYVVTLTVSDGLSNVTTTQILEVEEYIIGDADSGELLYNEQCFYCHQLEGIGGENNFYQPIPINRYLDNQADLFAKISYTMPPTAPNSCIDQCAADIEAYMKTWPRQEP